MTMGCAARKRARSVLLRLCALASLLAAAVRLSAQAVPAPEMSPAALVRSTVANEVAAARHTEIHHMFRSIKKTSKGRQTHLYVETNEAMAGMLLAINDHSLTAPQEQEEINHLNWLTGAPEQLRKKQAREKEDAERSLRIVKALPEAFRYEYAGSENGEAGLGKAGDELVKLKFTPNPSYTPPSRVEEVLEGMEGYLLIDRKAGRLARIDGALFRNISFGWGIFGRLDKGGHFCVQQGDVGDGTWEITKMDLNISGKILMVKNLSMVSNEVFNDFHREPNNLPFARGVELLKSEQEKLAQNGRPTSSTQNDH
jgi:hypothetical protein